MSELEKALAFNSRTKAALELLYGELNHGQQQKVLKNAEVKAMLERYGVISEEDIA